LGQAVDLSILTFPATIEFGRSGSKTFASRNEVNGFIANELKIWSEIVKSMPDGVINTASINGNEFAGVKSATIPPDQFIELFESNLLFTSDSKYYSEAHYRSRFDTHFFSGYLFYFQKSYAVSEYGPVFNEINLRANINFISGILAASRTLEIESFSEGKFALMAQLEKGIDSLEAKTSSSLSKLALLETSIQNSDQLIQKSVSEVENLRTNLGKDLEYSAQNLRSIVDDATQSSKESIKNLEKALKEDSLIATTSSYWQFKATSHIKRRNILATVCTVYAIFLIPTSIMASIILPELLKNRQDYYLIFVFGILLTIAFWAGRILTRILLSEHMLSSHSEEKKVFIDTYLALAREGEATDEERKLMLSTIYRHTSEIGNKDEGALETNLAAIAAKIMSPAKPLG
jgi:hypothetical protein